MPRFIKKPIIIEAEQFFSDKKPWPDGVIERDIGWFAINRKPFLPVPNGNGYLALNEGDWIITGIEGEKYPCKNSIFEKTYDPVKD